MTSVYDQLLAVLRKLPGLGYRSAERVALHLIVEKPELADDLVEVLQKAGAALGSCDVCGNLAESGEKCSICANPKRLSGLICVVERIPDLFAMERSGAFSGRYHVLHGKLSPVHGIGPEQLNLAALRERVTAGEVEELILALSNDIEAEATCHYIQQDIVGELPVRLSRIGFGLPSGGGVTLADAHTLKSALEGRRDF